LVKIRSKTIENNREQELDELSKYPRIQMTVKKSSENKLVVTLHKAAYDLNFVFNF
jgi:hypothetical protein